MRNVGGLTASEVNMLTQEDLKKILTYDPESGEFTWNLNVRRMRKGINAGRMDTKGYWTIQFKGSKYQAHRLAWLYIKGSFPDKDLDHIDGDKLNNKFSNLREVEKWQNSWNSKLAKNNKSGVKGISWCVASRKWVARITVRGVVMCLGCSSDKNYLKGVIDKARVEYHDKFCNFG